MIFFVFCLHFTIRQEVSPVCFLFFFSRSCAALVSLQVILCLLCKLARRTYSFECPPDILGAPYSLHARWGAYKKYCLCFRVNRVSGITQGNKSKSSTYQSMHWRLPIVSFYKLPDLRLHRLTRQYNICALRFATEVSADNSLQNYKKVLNYTNIFVIFLVFVPLRTHSHTLSRYVLLSRCKGTTIFWYRRSSFYFLFRCAQTIITCCAKK